MQTRRFDNLMITRRLCGGTLISDISLFWRHEWTLKSNCVNEIGCYCGPSKKFICRVLFTKKRFIVKYVLRMVIVVSINTTFHSCIPQYSLKLLIKLRTLSNKWKHLAPEKVNNKTFGLDRSSCFCNVQQYESQVWRR